VTGLVERFLRAAFPNRDITHAGDLYMRRFLLTPSVFGWQLMLHKIVRPDADHVLHDHPWDFATLCLRGGYVEVEYGPGETRLSPLLPGDLRLRAAEHVHRITEVIGPAAWTLVLHGPRRREWGFWDTSVSPPHWTRAAEYFTPDYDKAAPAARKFGGAP
jgi:hypothetical protein